MARLRFPALTQPTAPGVDLLPAMTQRDSACTKQRLSYLECLLEIPAACGQNKRAENTAPLAAGIKGRHRFPWEASRATLSMLLGAPQERVPVPPAIPEAPSPAPTYNCKVSAGSNACDDVGGDALPLAMVVLAKGADLQGAAGQRVVLAPAGLPYLGQGARGAWQREKTMIQKHVKPGKAATR